jgi:ketopantoate hydroxymethyltransferase
MAVLLIGCGGGGGGASAPQDPYQPPSDTTAPVITLNGDNPQEVDLNGEYVEAGATTDTGETVVIDASAVNTTAVGSYSVTYNATDSAGNEAAEVMRTVNVVDSGPGDSVAPVITLNGDNPQTVDLNGEYVEAGATTDTGETVDIDASAVDTSTVGSYVVTYDATDAAGNVAATVSRTVNVVDPSASATKLSVLTAVVDEIVIPNYKNLSDDAADFAADNGPVASYCDALGSGDEEAKLD